MKMKDWLNFIEKELGMTLEEFNKLPYRERYEYQEEFLKYL